jgi:hypothetical protein
LLLLSRLLLLLLLLLLGRSLSITIKRLVLLVSLPMEKVTRMKKKGKEE